MGYMKIGNLYKDRDIFLFQQCYALEKVHGTSAHVGWKDEALRFFAGGADHKRFVALFDEEELTKRFIELGHERVIVYGEAYGGKMQAMRETYGDELRFIAFEVRIGDTWLDVPNMTEVAENLGFEVVPWVRIEATIGDINAARDAPSAVAERRGCGERPREGVVLRPLIELTGSNGKRIIAKHKSESFQETRKPRPLDASQLEVLSEGRAIAEEWVTHMRLSHVLDGMGETNTEDTGRVIKAMFADVVAEAGEEIIVTKAARKAIGARTAKMFQARLRQETL